MADLFYYDSAISPIYPNFIISTLENFMLFRLAGEVEG